MSNPVIQAFFLGRALAEILSEKLEDDFTNALSELGKFDAEQRENLRQFIEEVQSRAERQAAQGTYTDANTSSSTGAVDLQEVIDELRAEIATVRSELKNYREQQPL
jgi:methyl-accepting chemotaxis protein